MKEKMSISKWYGSSRIRIPMIDSISFGHFVASNLGLVRSICSQRLDLKVEIKFTKELTASADQENNVIGISGLFLRGMFGNSEAQTANVTVAAISGIIVHELAHFAYSPKTLEPFAEYVKERTSCLFDEKIAMLLGNIIEDIYIEEEIERVLPNLKWMLDTFNEIFFTEAEESLRVSLVEGIKEAPTSPFDVMKILSLLILAKTRELTGLNDYLQSLFIEAYSAKDAVLLQDRFDIVLSLYERIMCNVERLDASEGDKKYEDAIRELIRKINNSLANRTIEQTMESTEGEYQRIVELNHMLKSCEESKISLVEDSYLDCSLHTSEIKLAPSSGRETVDVDTKYAELAQIARQRSVVNRPYGLDKVQGNSIRKLYRIATDSKIFAEPSPFQSYDHQEVIILVDCSGSMGYGDEKESRLYRAWSSAAGAAVALTEGRCQVAVYGHTADIDVVPSLTIYCAKSFSDSIDILPYTARTATQSECKENRDGTAIRFIGGKFQSKTRQRFLIVISDGQPIACRYEGITAIKHTAEEVKRLRSNGINVLSISITPEASQANDVIYGEEHNVYDEDPNIIQKIVDSIITK